MAGVLVSRLVTYWPPVILGAAVAFANAPWGSVACPAHRSWAQPTPEIRCGLGCCHPDRGQGPCDLFQRFALRGDPEHDLDQAADDHHAATDQVADEQPERIATVADQMAVEDRPERAEALGDGEDAGDGLGADLQREDLADSQVGGARAGGGEEEDDAPGDRLGGGVSTPWLNR